MRKIAAFLHKRFSISSGHLITLLSFYFLLLLNISFWRFIFVHAEPAGLTGYLFMASIPLLIFTLLYLTFSLLTLPYVGKPLLILILLISAGVNYLSYQFGVFIDADMVRNTFETNPGEVKDLITLRSLLWFFVLGVIPSVLLWKTKITFSPFWKELLTRLKRCGLVLLCLILFTPFVYKQYASFGRNNNQVRRLVIPLNYIYATFRYFQIEHQNKRPFTKLDEAAEHVPYPDEEKTVFILILGETARAQNFSLNGYVRETTPLLKKQDIVNFRHVQSAGTATAFSVPAIFSFTPRSRFSPTDAKYTENLLDLLQQTGYEILWKENDNGCKGVCQRVPNVEMDVKDKRFCDGTYCHDEILLEGLEDYLANFQGNNLFIVLHTIGSHGPTYFRRYPEQFKKFTPTCDTEEIQTCTQEQIVNTYDNTILYTDYIVSSVIDILKKFPAYESGLLYVSDHGESLGENGVYLHGIPYAIAPKEQTSVPMVLWMSEVMKKSDHLDYECLKKKAQTGQFSHDNLSHSILSLMEVDSRVYDPKMDFFDECRLDPLPRKAN
ncbi:phosphoethanolamine transferase [Candidatus Avelusimicrobium gallicola]|uniref:Phosphoethanolamine transferase n=1 Tax=Candidatus Avelusimicrobium gallicola TaxID=2562704 RepID=A0A1Y4DAA2_9BACT|nr:phosphoethanolamine--lipid A transferase [Elusimicrobium sp. An273]OUO56164.1 phosphoethanolamine transferase [Elusimicrobium sp. An273]